MVRIHSSQHVSNVVIVPGHSGNEGDKLIDRSVKPFIQRLVGINRQRIGIDLLGKALEQHKIECRQKTIELKGQLLSHFLFPLNIGFKYLDVKSFRENQLQLVAEKKSLKEEEQKILKDRALTLKEEDEFFKEIEDYLQQIDDATISHEQKKLSPSAWEYHSILAGRLYAIIYMKNRLSLSPARLSVANRILTSSIWEFLPKEFKSQEMVSAERLAIVAIVQAETALGSIPSMEI